eukprot:gnl/TRDRNA2_/TRDRNA2_177533_c10_seq2.p1 gnl/TRDRNA2_/TRDRNA2_177533_c10~~gnl/TRDRNA2_/TRDRNA2_177533_c10_seq2.p1  ORF type:complete len:704 (+),score=255.75 gnl/TRDRNA2_/TRDRNA2_177533_c10_seq2:89-2200(+)
MAVIAVRVFCSLFLLAVAAQAETVNPMDKVFQLMDELTAKIKKEGEEEDKAFKEFFEWCDDAAGNTKNSIKTATSTKEKLESTIEKAAADTEAAATSIEELAASIATAEADLKAATEIRKKEAADFATVESELVDGIDTLDRAIATIEKEMGSAALLQERVDSKNVQALLTTLNVVIAKAGINADDKSKLVSMVQNHQSSDDSDSDLELGAPAAATYKSHSGGILDILEDMKEKAEAELADARKAEAKAVHEFSMLKQGLTDQIAADSHDLAVAKSTKAESEETKGTAEGDLAETVDELKKLTTYLDTISNDCMSTAQAHEESVKSRAEELAVIAEAKKIVQDAVGGAVSQSYSLLQVEVASKEQSRMYLANLEVVAAVKKLAREQHSSALAQLASRVSAVIRYGGSNSEDIFAKIKGLISDMIAKLQKEAAEAANQKAYCDEEMAKNKAKHEELTSDIETLSAKIDKAAASSAGLKEEVAVLQEELSELAKTTMEMDAARSDEHAAYMEAKTDLQAGIDGVQKALEVLRSYYGSASLVQSDNFNSFMQQPAVPTHSKSGDSGGSIINILEQCEADFSKDLAHEETKEQEAQTEYDKISQENKIMKTTKDQDVKYKTKEAKGLDKAVAENSGDRAGLQTELSAVLEYQSKLDKQCIAKVPSYEERKAAREAEITGLKEALKILDSEGVFLQKPHRHLRAVVAH